MVGALTVISCKKDQTPVPVKPSNPVSCEDTVFYQQQILPTLQNECFNCHANGTSPLLNNHASVKNNASIMLNAMRGQGAPLMPQGGPALPKEFIDAFACWIEQGSLNN